MEIAAVALWRESADWPCKEGMEAEALKGDAEGPPSCNSRAILLLSWCDISDRRAVVMARGFVQPMRPD